MKNIIGFVAVILAITMSAFTKVETKKATTDYYWFKMKSLVNITPGNIVANNQADYLLEFDGTPPSASGCSGATHYCVVGFLPTQVNGTPGTIKANQIPSSQGNLKN